MGKLFLTCGEYIDNSKGMDAIVNAANPYMIYGSGICGAVYKAAGLELEEYCKKTYSSNMETGKVRITPGFNLNMDIIHIVGPRFYQEKDPINKLMDCYKNLLKEIKNNGYKKVLLPSISTGTYGYKHNDVAKPLIQLLTDFCDNNDIDLYLNNSNPISKDIYLKYYLNIKGLNLKKDYK